MHDDGSGSEPRLPRVLVIDSSSVARSRLSAELGRWGVTVLAEAGTDQLARLVDDFEPHLAVIECGDDPTEVVRAVRDDVPVLVVAPAEAPTSTHLAAIAAGASDVLTTRSDPSERTARVLSFLRRHDGLLHFDDVAIDEPAHIASRDGHLLDLTATEFRLLTTLVRHAGTVMSKRQLLDLVWGFDGYDVNVVEVHMSALRRKLERHGPRLIHTVRSLGYVARRPARLQANAAPTATTPPARYQP